MRAGRAVLLLFGFWLEVVPLAAPSTAGDIPNMLGGGNVILHRDPAKAEAQLEVLESLGAGMCRIPVDENRYYSPRDRRPHPELYDPLILAAYRHRVRPVFLFEYYIHGRTASWAGGRNGSPWAGRSPSGSPRAADG
jgi:hypothetical protein